MAPQISPDGNFWWDGQAWQPMGVQAAGPAVEQAPAPAPAATDQPAWLDQPIAATATATAPPPPEAMVEQAPPAQQWNSPAARSSRMWIYATGVLLIVAIGVTALYVRAQLTTTNENTASVQVASPSPLVSDYERADRFLNVDLGPSLTEVVNAMPSVQSRCTSKLPPACKDALIALDNAMLDVDDAMSKSQSDIPVCIGRAVQQFKFDWTGMEQGVAQAIGGYKANSRALIIQGLQKFASIAQYLKPDISRIDKAEATCSKTV